MKIVQERTKGEVEMTLASDALGSPDIVAFCRSKKSGYFGTFGGGVDKAVPGNKSERGLRRWSEVKATSG